MVREIAHGKLREQAGDGAEAVDDGKLVRAVARLDHVVRQQGVEGRRGHARTETGDDAQRRDAEQLADAEMHPLADLGIAEAGQAERHQRGHQGDRRQGEQAMAGGIGEVEGQRADAAGSPGDGHVEREDAAAIVAARLVVQPALDHHILSGDGIAHEDAQSRPDIGVVEDEIEQGGVGRDGGEDAEGADMADPVDHPVASSACPTGSR